jgi:hypothetical protein
MRSFKFLVSFLCVFAAASASAGLINNTDGTFTDTTTGYLWKTLGQFNGKTYGQAVAGLAGDFHAASFAELATLTNDAPATPSAFAADSAAMGAVSSRSLIWGFFGDGTHWAWKFSADTHWNTNDSTYNGWTSYNYAVTPNQAYSDLGLFAVSTSGISSVPESSSLVLLLIGLMMIVVTRRRA